MLPHQTQQMPFGWINRPSDDTDNQNPEALNRRLLIHVDIRYLENTNQAFRVPLWLSFIYLDVPLFQALPE